MSDELGAEVETGVAPPPMPGMEEHEPATIPDFSRREFALRELMDEPCTYADYCRAATDLAQVNKVTRGYGATLDFLERVLRKTGVTQEPLHVVDVGCAQGDGLRTIYRWAAKRSVPLKLTGIDMNPYAARLARECDRREYVAAKKISWVTADAFAIELDRPADVVISSLFTHHLPDEGVVRYLRWCEDNARVGWMVNDLRRSERAAAWFSRLAWVMGWDRMVVEDGPVSFRRAFVEADWERYLAEAGVSRVKVYGGGVGRLCVERVK